MVGAEGKVGRFPLEAASVAVRSRLKAARAAVRRRLDEEEPEIFLVLGSGLGGLVDGVEDSVTIPFHEIPGFPRAGVEGHSGHLVFGTLEGRRVLLQAGRFHFYEGHPADVVVAPVRLAAALGAGIVILTNAAGGIAKPLEPGSIMLLDDHLNLMWRNPLPGPVHGGEGRLSDRGYDGRLSAMTRPYDPSLGARVMELAGEMRIPLYRGTYAAVLGPSYETPAEVRFLESAGAHAVGMSTVPEAIAAGALGLRVVAFSLITNRAAGMGSQKLDHREVMEVGRRAGGRLKSLLHALIRELPPD
ncbi:MAG: purine-nucleoside phosphorylase [Longimicrobiales bacterium]